MPYGSTNAMSSYSAPSRKRSRYSAAPSRAGFKKQRARVALRPRSRSVAYAGELKGMDTLLAESPVIDSTSTNAGIFAVNLIQTGTGSWNRIGRKVALHSLRIWGTALFTYAEFPTSGNLRANKLRMVVVWDKQPSGGSLPTFDTIFGSTVQDGTEATGFLDAIKYDSMDRFVVLRDKKFDFQVEAFNAAGGTVDNISENVDIDEYIRLGGRECNYSGQSTPMTISDINSGALYVIFRADQNDTASSILISPQTKCRLRYRD